MPRERMRTARWGVGASAWILGMIAVRPLAGSDPTLIIAQTVIELSPGGLATWTIDTFGKLAQPLVVSSVAAGIIAAGVIAGYVVSSVMDVDPGDRRLEIVVAVSVLTVTAVGFYAATEALTPRWALATGLALLAPAVVWLAGASPERPVGRRRVLRQFGAGAGTLLAGGTLARIVGQRESAGIQPGTDLDPVGSDSNGRDETVTTARDDRTARPDPDEKTGVGTTTPAATPTVGADGLIARRQTAGVVVSRSNAEGSFGFDFEGMPSRVGNAADHYVVDKNVSPVEVDTEYWSLSISGTVEDEQTYSLQDLNDHPQARELTVTMVCISNSVGGDLISTTDWVGVPMRALLEDAGVTDAARDVVTRADDGYTEALPWEVIRDREDILIAIGMDGQTLPREHGFPARLLIPGRYGMKSTKWVTEIEPVDRDYTGYWERRGWDEEAVVGTFSYIRAVQRRYDRVAIGGIAYAGLRGIDRVEVSVDGGETWADATLEAPPSPYAWRRWRRVVERPDSGPIDIETRATDGEGNRQPNEPYRTTPGGYWHNVTVSL
ncbi:MAG: molybdopterin-dependent oxidoreductase [Halorhabdus sp.]